MFKSILHHRFIHKFTINLSFHSFFFTEFSGNFIPFLSIRAAVMVLTTLKKIGGNQNAAR